MTIWETYTWWNLYYIQANNIYPNSVTNYFVWWVHLKSTLSIIPVFCTIFLSIVIMPIQISRLIHPNCKFVHFDQYTSTPCPQPLLITILPSAYEFTHFCSDSTWKWDHIVFVSLFGLIYVLQVHSRCYKWWKYFCHGWIIFQCVCLCVVCPYSLSIHPLRDTKLFPHVSPCE